MTLTEAVKSELRATFGPQWVSSATQFAIAAAGIAFVSYVGLQVFNVAADIGLQLQEIK